MSNEQTEIETFNKFMVGSRGDKLCIMNPPRGDISQDDALLLAAYLVSMSDWDETRFAAVLAAVKNS